MRRITHSIYIKGIRCIERIFLSIAIEPNVETIVDANNPGVIPVAYMSRNKLVDNFTN